MALATALDGSVLCLACGFCCDGTLHHHTVLRPGEEAGVAALGLQVEAWDGRAAFRQPCPMFRELRCTIYAQRPHVCRRYECALLGRYLAGEVTLAQALAAVEVATGQLAVFRGYAPASPGFMGWLKALEASITAEPDGETAALEPEALQHTLALAVYLHRRFGTDDEQAETSARAELG